jgi:hypothetical protein
MLSFLDLYMFAYLGYKRMAAIESNLLNNRNTLKPSPS